MERLVCGVVSPPVQAGVGTSRTAARHIAVAEGGDASRGIYARIKLQCLACGIPCDCAVSYPHACQGCLPCRAQCARHVKIIGGSGLSNTDVTVCMHRYFLGAGDADAQVVAAIRIYVSQIGTLIYLCGGAYGRCMGSGGDDVACACNVTADVRRAVERLPPQGAGGLELCRRGNVVGGERIVARYQGGLRCRGGNGLAADGVGCGAERGADHPACVEVIFRAAAHIDVFRGGIGELSQSADGIACRAGTVYELVDDTADRSPTVG